MKNKTQDPLDTLLDAAVKTYVDAEPLNGLEDRILNRASLVRSGRSSKFGPLLAIGATLALSCFFVAGLKHKRIELKNEASAVVRVPPTLPIPIYREVKTTHTHRLRRLPKRNVFPTPEPPSAEELALLNFLERNPKEAAQTFAGLQQIDAPLDIAPLEIKPLETDESNN